VAAIDGDDIVWKRIVLESFDVVGERGRQCVEADGFEPIRQRRIAGDADCGFKTKHAFDNGAEFDALHAGVAR